MRRRKFDDQYDNLYCIFDKELKDNYKNSKSEMSKKQIDCLAKMLAFELAAEGESLIGVGSTDDEEFCGMFNDANETE